MKRKIKKDKAIKMSKFLLLISNIHIFTLTGLERA